MLFQETLVMSPKLFELIFQVFECNAAADPFLQNILRRRDPFFIRASCSKHRLRARSALQKFLWLIEKLHY